MASCWSFSQGLTPTVQQATNDTLFCFSVVQSKELARRLATSAYNDSLAMALTRENERLYTLVNNQTRQAKNLELKVRLTNIAMENQERTIQAMEDYLEQQDKVLHRSKREKRLMALGLAALAVLSVVQ